jgi:hypothetical protein
MTVVDLRIEGGLDWHLFQPCRAVGIQRSNSYSKSPWIIASLFETLYAGPTGEFAFICCANGKSMTKESFGNAFSEACRAAGIQKSRTGLRKIGVYMRGKQRRDDSGTISTPNRRLSSQRHARSPSWSMRIIGTCTMFCLRPRPFATV